EPGDIENNLNRIPGVLQSAETASRDSQGQVRHLSAFVVTEGVSADVIRKALEETLPAYMIPKIITVTDRLPVNTNGKTDRKALTE
ncbi:MAG: D-alanine--poly(phosphoribitol) ligase subunit DltA, partial [Lachnospiraceae bacterium]|nr:D-alanine--poly(phosphoribitol) ligase subunit DltA [Lachnospiraceae bacterium]